LQFILNQSKFGTPHNGAFFICYFYPIANNGVGKFCSLAEIFWYQPSVLHGENFGKVANLDAALKPNARIET
jgi:hypothetical protein